VQPSRFPTVGASRISGTFQAKDRTQLTAAVDKYVTIYGRLKYKVWDTFPYAIHADELVVHDACNGGLDAIRGIAPDATGLLNSREFVDGLADEW
jgi:hypothetical protein